MRPLQHVIWDWNGTLLDDTDLCIDVMNGLLAERNLPLLTRARYHEVFDFPVIDYYRRLGFNFDRDPFPIVGAEFIRRYETRRDESPLHDHARATLAAIRGLGLRQSVLSAYRHDTLLELLAHHELTALFDGVLGSDNVYAFGKTEQGRRWIQHLGIPPEAVVLIGDTVHDYDVAQAMQCRCLLVSNGYHPRPKLQRCGVPVVEDLVSVTAWLRQQG